jgi:predicted TIM-barrel fold metal-dependent hydrolase
VTWPTTEVSAVFASYLTGGEALRRDGDRHSCDVHHPNDGPRRRDDRHGHRRPSGAPRASESAASVSATPEMTSMAMIAIAKNVIVKISIAAEPYTLPLFGTAPVHSCDAIQARVEHFYQSRGIKGLLVKTRWQVHPTSPDRSTSDRNDPLCFPIFEVAQRNDIPVFFHTGFGGPNPQNFAPKFRISLSDPLLLEDVAIRFPKLKIVIAHMGWPFLIYALYMLWAYENVYLDTAVVDWIVGSEMFNRMLKEAVDTVGSDRILFGSDQMVWPQMITPAVESIRNATFLTNF